ncbi:MAG: hypothetical protein WBH24_00305, partial [Candidatus Acidiferrum sp.]
LNEGPFAQERHRLTYCLRYSGNIQTVFSASVTDLSTRDGPFSRTRDRRSSGDIPVAFLIARAKERGEAKPTAKETSLIAKDGFPENNSSDFATSVSRRKAL